MGEELVSDGARCVPLAYVDAKVRTLLGEPYYSVNNAMDVDRVLKFMRLRALAHTVEFKPASGKYEATVDLPLETPVTLETINEDPAIALGLLGLKMAELAGI
jgi:hypothetical protein